MRLLFMLLCMFSSSCAAYVPRSSDQDTSEQCTANKASDEQVDAALDIFDAFFGLSKKIDSYTPKVFVDSFRNSYSKDELRQLIEALLCEAQHLQKSVIQKFYTNLSEEASQLVVDIKALQISLSDDEAPRS